ncbi:MAG: FAD-dependent oxidoreductase [Comamonadaceae bacterium]|nr:FAD-dependent oxidoreductase [Comamonadaceae bacterium]
MADVLIFLLRLADTLYIIRGAARRKIEINAAKYPGRQGERPRRQVYRGCSPDPMSDATQVLIVGAGPAGCAAALTLARAGMAVTLVDQHRFRATRRAATPSSPTRWRPWTGWADGAGADGRLHAAAHPRLRAESPSRRSRRQARPHSPPHPRRPAVQRGGRGGRAVRRPPAPGGIRRAGRRHPRALSPRRGRRRGGDPGRFDAARHRRRQRPARTGRPARAQAAFRHRRARLLPSAATGAGDRSPVHLLRPRHRSRLRLDLSRTGRRAQRRRRILPRFPTPARNRQRAPRVRILRRLLLPARQLVSEAEQVTELKGAPLRTAPKGARPWRSRPAGDRRGRGHHLLVQRRRHRQGDGIRHAGGGNGHRLARAPPRQRKTRAAPMPRAMRQRLLPASPPTRRRSAGCPIRRSATSSPRAPRNGRFVRSQLSGMLSESQRPARLLSITGFARALLR